MKKAGLKERSPFIFGRGIFIVVILIPVSLSFILGYFVGKSTLKENPELKQLQEIQSNTVQPVETQSQEATQSQISEPSAAKDLQPAESQSKAVRESPTNQKPTPTLYTVQVGAFKNAADAEALSMKIKKTESLQAFVTVKKEDSIRQP